MSADSTLFSEVAWKKISASLKLSGREVQIVHCLFQEATETEVASRLGISAHTVHTHLNRLFLKLDVKSRTELTLRVVQEFVALARSSATSECRCVAGQNQSECPICRLFG